MTDSKDFDSIMREITRGLSGNAEEDITYLQEQMEKYKDHEMNREIIRACGRLLYELIPDEKKDKISQLFDNERAGLNAVLEEARFNIYKKDFDKALSIMEALVEKVEALHAFEDDEVSEYHVFEEYFEEILYRYREEPEKDIRQAQIPYTEIYMLYGSLLVEMKRLPEAQAALEKGLRWNPVCFTIMAEYIETFKMSGDLERFFDMTKDAFSIAFRAGDVARLFRNLAFCFVEKQLWSEALGCLMLSMNFDRDNTNAQSEMYYIHSVTKGNVKEPSEEQIREYAVKYGFPAGADQEILNLSFSCGADALKKNMPDAAKYFLSITYDLTKDEEIKKFIDKIPGLS